MSAARKKKLEVGKILAWIWLMAVAVSSVMGLVAFLIVTGNADPYQWTCIQSHEEFIPNNGYIKARLLDNYVGERYDEKSMMRYFEFCDRYALTREAHD